MKRRVLILGGEQYKTISIVRSLGRKEIDVDVVGKNKFAMCFFSKYCKRRYILPSNKKLWLKELLKILRNKEYHLVIPSSEEESLILSKVKEKLPVILPSYESLVIASNKIQTIKFMKSLGIPLPKTWIIKNLKDLDKIKEKLDYPVILRPSYYKYSHRPHYVFKKEDFVNEYLWYHRKSLFPFIQGVIIGDSYGVFALCKNGKILQYFAHKRIIEQDPKGSGSARCASSKLYSELKKYSDKIVKHLKWNGVIMFEFKHDAKDKTFKLIEINGRFWGSLSLAIHAGVNFPYQLYCLATGEKLETIKKWKTVCARHILGEIIYFFRVLKGKPRNWSLHYPGIWEALKKIVSSKCKFFVLDLEDPLPFFIEFIYKISNVVKH